MLQDKSKAAVQVREQWDGKFVSTQGKPSLTLDPYTFSWMPATAHPKLSERLLCGNGVLTVES